MPDSSETRLGQLEQEQARLGVRLQTIEQQVTDLRPLTTGLVRLEGRVSGLRDDVHDVGERVSAVQQSVEDKAQAQVEERRSLRVALIGLTAVIVAAMIAAAATLISAGVHP
jgi:chaperonin cofactor prefoldin